MTRAVLKIGGGILRSREDLETLVRILKMNSHRENVLVVSALSGVTDSLLQAYAKGKDITAELKKKHDSYFDTENPAFDAKFAELKALLQQKGKTVERKERVASFGERLSAILVSEYLNAHGIPALAMDAEQCGIVADGRFEKANCMLAKTRENFARGAVPAMEGKTLVITGYYGVDDGGNVNTFGRGGSDYSAAVVAAACNARVLEIWKDVEGFMTANPKIVPDARKLDEVTFEEAKELGYLGAKILHPRTMDVLIGSNVFVEIKSVLAPGNEGTRIVERSTDSKREVTSISAKKGIALVTIKGGSMVDVPGVAAQVFTSIAKAGVSIDTIATSQVNISFTIDEGDAENADRTLRKALPKLRDDFEIRKGLAVVGVVGEGMAHVPGIAARVFGAVAKRGVSITLISQAATGINITFMVGAEHAEECVRAIHSEFRLGA